MFTQGIFFVVSKPAPSFNGTAVIDGAFKQIKLSDFKGNLYISARMKVCLKH